MEGKAVLGSVLLLSAHVLEGVLWLEVPCAGYEELKALSAALEYEGRVCGRSGWNSDRGVAYYNSGRKSAVGVK